MTGEEMRTAIEFLLNSQADLTAKLGMLTNDIAAMKAQADADRQRADARAEADRETVREAVAGLSANLVRLAEGARERFEQLEARADHDRRAMREVVEGLKDMIYTAHDRADGAHKRIDKLESDAA